jgi:hypothetical protein
VRRALAFLILFTALAAPGVQAAERTLKARLLEIDGAHDRVRADVRGRPTVYSVANAGLLRGFRKGDLVLLRVRGATVIDVRLAELTAVLRPTAQRAAAHRRPRRAPRWPGPLRGQLRRGDFVRSRWRRGTTARAW